MGTFEKPDDGELRKQLGEMAYQVTQCSRTEPAFHNAYWNEHRPGLYVDRVSGQPLFSSREKFDSGTGWPSFTNPLDAAALIEQEDRTLPEVRTEVRSSASDSHLGHVFPDGPGPAGLRYCINSAALRFIPVEELENEGYGEWKKLWA